MAKPEMTFEQWWVGSHYVRFVEQEGAPLYEGSYLEDLSTLKLADWERRGGKVGYTRLADQEKISFQIVEIPPKGQLKPEHHMYEAVMYVLKGAGATEIWQEGEPKRTIEWSEGALLAIPLNAWHQEFNNSGSEPCRIAFGTNMSQVINLYHDVNYVFNNPYSFKNRYSYSMDGYYSDEGTKRNLRLFETNFIPDIRTFNLDEWKERGTRTSIMRLYMGNASSQIHILEVGEGTYVTAHRHGHGPHVMVVGGEGYELLFFPGGETDASKRQKVPVKPYGVVAPKLNEFHQHFNTGKGPFRQLAFKGWDPSGASISAKGKYDPVGAARSDNPFAYSFKLRYDKEDPKIREEYYQALENNGISLRLAPLDQGGG